MEPRYQTLSIIYEIVKNDPNPSTYQCSPRELILRQSNDWDNIKQSLDLLEKEGLITIRQLDKQVISITPEGIERAMELSKVRNQALL